VASASDTVAKFGLPSREPPAHLRLRLRELRLLPHANSSTRDLDKATNRRRALISPAHHDQFCTTRKMGSIANDSKYGLHAAVVGSDIGRSRRVASSLRAGRVVINGMTDDPQAPWGGFKYSGVGREYGQYGIEAFLETRAVLEA
jgi:Aldehyde dehydrogenase family